jgi:hypothetical protein
VVEQLLSFWGSRGPVAEQSLVCFQPMQLPAGVAATTHVSSHEITTCPQFMPTSPPPHWQ